MIAHDDVDVALIQAPNLIADYGIELLDENDELVSDLSEYLVGPPDITHDVDALIPGDCKVQILSQPYMGARVRLFETLSDGVVTRRYDRGVFVLSTPVRDPSESPASWTVQGYDKMYYLQHEVGDTYVVPQGANYLAAVAQVFIDAGYIGSPPLLDGTASGKTVPAARVWSGTVQVVQWAKVANDLLKDIGYCPVYADEVGVPRSEPDLVPSVRASEFTFDLTNDDIDIVEAPRDYTEDGFEDLNRWLFIRDGLDFPPAEGSGLYTVDRTGGGVPHPKVVHLTAADQDSLVSQGDVIVAADTAKTATWSITTAGPFPIGGHRDVATLIDPELGTFKVAIKTQSGALASNASLKLEVV